MDAHRNGKVPVLRGPVLRGPSFVVLYHGRTKQRKSACPTDYTRKHPRSSREMSVRRRRCGEPIGSWSTEGVGPRFRPAGGGLSRLAVRGPPAGSGLKSPPVGTRRRRGRAFDSTDDFRNRGDVLSADDADERGSRYADHRPNHQSPPWPLRCSLCGIQDRRLSSVEAPRPCPDRPAPSARPSDRHNQTRKIRNLGKSWE
jgi:hypothetical protein